MAAIMSAGERKNLRISRSTMAIMRALLKNAAIYFPHATGDWYSGASTVWSRNWRPV